MEGQKPKVHISNYGLVSDPNSSSPSAAPSDAEADFLVTVLGL